jgi:hypothetical protein
MQQFRMVKKWFSPFPALGAVLNAEVYFLLGKAQPEAQARQTSQS